MGSIATTLGGIILTALPVVAEPIFAQEPQIDPHLEQIIKETAFQSQEFPDAKIAITIYFHYVLDSSIYGKQFREALNEVIVNKDKVEKREVKRIGITTKDRTISAGDIISWYDEPGNILERRPLSAQEAEALTPHFINVPLRRYSLIEPKAVGTFVRDGFIHYFIQANLKGITDKEWWVVYKNRDNKPVAQLRLEWEGVTTEAESGTATPFYIFRQNEKNIPPHGRYRIGFEIRDPLNDTIRAYIIRAQMVVDFPRPIVPSEKGKN